MDSKSSAKRCCSASFGSDSMNESFNEYSIKPQALITQLNHGNLFETNTGIDKLTMSKSHYLMGKIYYDKADLLSAQGHFLGALELGDQPVNVFSSLKTIGFLIRIASEMLENGRASGFITQAEKLVDDMTSILGSLNAEYFYNIGILQNYKGQFEDAKQSFELCARKAKEENEPDLLSKCLLALASTNYNNKKYDATLDDLHKLNQLLRIIDKTYVQGSMCLFSGKTYLALGRYDEALKYLSQANSFLQSKKCWNLYGYIMLWKGIAYKGLGQYDRALLFFNQGLESIDHSSFRRLKGLLEDEILDVNDSSVDIYLDRTNRRIKERNLGVIDFKHRFVLLEILFLLAKSPGSFYNKEDLAKLIWKDEYNPLIHDKLIYTSISRLRRLIEPKKGNSEKRKYIIRGKDGYTFNSLVKIRFLQDGKTTSAQSIANVEISSPV